MGAGLRTTRKWLDFPPDPTVARQSSTLYGLGLAHIPTGSLAANQAYFMIAALAWNLKTWMLNLLDLGDGAVMRFQRFRYLWIWQAGVVAMRPQYGRAEAAA